VKSRAAKRQQLNVSLRVDDYDAIKAAAAARGMSMARYIVASCLPDRGRRGEEPLNRLARPISKEESAR
jgi:hypothetical protein